LNYSSVDYTVPGTIALKPLDFLVLLALAEEERHGYGIRRDVFDLSSGAVSVDAGNLYRTLARLVEAGLVARSSRRPAADADDERRRYFRITPKGWRALAADARRLQQLLRHAKVRRLLAGAAS
jgi:DNA-binding PadR family transcriptional regulator